MGLKLSKPNWIQAKSKHIHIWIQYIENILSEVFRLIDSQPLREHDFRASADPVDVSNHQAFIQLKKHFQKSSGFVFVLGAWGTGKTHLVRQFCQDQSHHANFKQRSFFGVESVLHAKVTFFSFFDRIFLLIIMAIIFWWWSPVFSFGSNGNIFTPALIVQILGIVLTFVFANIFMVCYILVSALIRVIEIVLDLFISMRPLPHVLILEDLDRSTLSLEERFSFLAGLPLLGRRVIVPIGYSDEESKGQLMQFCSKLSPDVILLRQDPSVVYSIVKRYFPDFPFKEPGKWMGEVPVRDILGMCETAQVQHQDSVVRFRRNVIFSVKVKINEILKPVSGDTSEYILQISGGKIELTATSATRMSPNEDEIFSSFRTSLDQELFVKQLSEIVTDRERAESNSWIDILFRKYMSSASSEEVIGRIEDRFGKKYKI